VIADSLIDRMAQRIGGRYLTFGDSPADVGLPSPALNRRYLLYLHIPFCVVLCPFCSFHRVEFQRDRAEQYFRALQLEIRIATEAGYRFDEMYIGGGTPTVMPDELLATIRLVRELHPMSRISAETNPDDLDDHKLPLLHDVGVSRLSVGVQSFDDKLLQEMQRYDKYGSSDEIRRRLNRVQGAFETLNVDMIFNFPHQTEESLRNDLEILTDDVNANQVSYYPLMATYSTRRSMLRTMGAVDFRRERRMYQQIVRHMSAAGYTRSSAWCFSRDGDMIDEYITDRYEYLGLGSGAFSYLNGNFFASTFSINHYLRLIEAGKTSIVRKRATSRLEQMRYYLLIRMFGGSLDPEAAERKFDGGFRRGIRRELIALRLLGAIRNCGGRLQLTDRGYYIWIIMMREFFTGVNKLREEMRHNISKENV
jgi:coproporphyrinogen III oxidase-like Fe-S oxidoreductase